MCKRFTRTWRCAHWVEGVTMLLKAVHLCLILLAASFATEETTTESETLEELASASSASLPQCFRWGCLRSDSFQLTWNATCLGEGYADIIRVKAVTRSYFPFFTHAIAAFSLGSLTVGELGARTNYTVTVDALQFECTVQTFRESIEILPVGEPMPVFGRGSSCTHPPSHSLQRTQPP